MIRDTSTQDEVIDRPGALSRRRLIAGVSLAVLVGAGVLLGPAIGRWSSAEHTVVRERLRLSTVERGDLERDVTAQGVVVAAVKPTLFSPAAGVVTGGVTHREPEPRLGLCCWLPQAPPSKWGRTARAWTFLWPVFTQLDLGGRVEFRFASDFDRVCKTFLQAV